MSTGTAPQQFCGTAVQEDRRCAAQEERQAAAAAAAAADAALESERYQEAARETAAARQAAMKLEAALAAERRRGADLAHQLAGLRRVFEEAGLLHAAAGCPQAGADGMRSLKRELLALQCVPGGDCRG